MTRPQLGFISVVVLLVAGTAVGSITMPEEGQAVSEKVAVVGASVVCPDLRQVPGELATRISVGAAPLASAQVGPVGSITATNVAGKQVITTVPVTEPGQVAVGLGADLHKNALIVTARGALASGMEVEAITRAVDHLDRGLAGFRCAPPRPESWFVGGATTDYDTSILVLVNSDDVAATVDVSVLSITGPADPRPGQGISVGPRSRVIIAMDTLAPGRAWLAVNVKSRRGRVAAALRHQRGLGRVPLGVEWVPQVAAPAGTVVVPGFPKGPGARVLVIANPGLDDTSAQVQVTTKDGQFVPTGLDDVNVPARTTVRLLLNSVTDQSSLAVRVTSTGGPILAGGYVDDAQVRPIHEIAYTGGGQPLAGQALITDVVIDRPTESTLILSAPDTAAEVVITPITVLGSAQRLPAARRVAIPAGRTVEFRLSTFFDAGFFVAGSVARLAVQVRPTEDSGPVYAARYLRERGPRGPLTTLLVLQGPAAEVARPIARHDPQSAS